MGTAKAKAAGRPTAAAAESTRGAASPVHAAIHADAAAHSGPSRQRALKKHMPQPMVRAHIKSSTAAAAESTRGASSPAHAAYTPMMPLLCRVLQSSGPSRQRALKTSARRPPHASQPSSRSHRLAEAGCAAADCGASITRSGKHARRVLPRARRHTCRCCRALRPPSRQRALKKTAPQPMVRAHIKWPAAAAHKARAARPPPRTPPYMLMLPRTPTPFTPAGAEKAHAAADGSGAYQIVDRRRSAKHARRVLPRARRHTCRCCRALRPPHASQPSSRSHRLAEAGCAAADCGASITRTWYGVGVGCAAAAARCASAPVSVPESVACG